MTKNAFLCLLCIVCLPLFGFTQNSKFVIGLEYGPNLTQMWGNSVVTQFTRLSRGHSLGFNVRYAINDQLSIQTGVSQELKVSNSKPLPNGSHERREFEYLTTPILVCFNTKRQLQKNIYFVNVGPYHSALIGHTKIVENPADGTKIIDKSTQDYKLSDYGLSSGLGVQRNLGTVLAISLEFRTNLGMYNISSTPIVGDRALRMSSFSLLLGVWYRLPSND